MNALIKSSMLLLPATAIAVYLYAMADDEGFETVRSQPQDAICKQDGERLARLQAKPSLDEGLTFVGEIRCQQLWPQLQTIVDGLSNPSRSTALTSPNRAASDMISASDAAPTTASPASDDACKHDEDRLAELQAHPSINAAIRFDSELKCPRLQPQLPAILDQLSHAAGSVEAGSRKAPAPDTISARAAVPPALESPAIVAKSATPDDACKHDEERLAALQAKPSLDEAVRFEDELKCSKLQPQLLALLDSLSQAPHSAGAPSPNEAPPNTTSADDTASPASKSSAMEATSATSGDACKRDEERLADLQAKPSIEGAIRLESELRCPEVWPQLLAILDSLSQAPQSAGAASPNEAPPKTTSTGEAALRASEPPASEAASAASNDACKQDEERLARLRTTPSSEEAARFAQDLRCETLRPQLLALTGALAKPSPPDSQSISQDAGAERNVTNETQPASQAVLDAERRIAALESEKEALAAEVSRLERDRESPPAGPAGPPAPPQPATPAERSASEPASQAAAAAVRRIAQLESEKEALTAEVSRLQHDRESPPAEPAGPPASPPPATPAERSESEPALQAVADAERRIAQLESEKEALAAEVSGLQRERESPSAEQAVPPASPPPATPAEQPESEPVAALASLPEGMPARVLIRYLANNADARAQAEKLANALARQGVDVADLRESRSAIRTELSFSYAPDETIAQRVGRLVGVAPVRRPQPKDALMVRPGTIELNLSSDSHLAAINTTSRRESNHE
jgi:hypothetical protein